MKVRKERTQAFSSLGADQHCAVQILLHPTSPIDRTVTFISVPIRPSSLTSSRSPGYSRITPTFSRRLHPLRSRNSTSFNSPLRPQPHAFSGPQLSFGRRLPSIRVASWHTPSRHSLHSKIPGERATHPGSDASMLIPGSGRSFRPEYSASGRKSER